AGTDDTPADRLGAEAGRSGQDASSWANAQAASSAPADRSAPLVARDRDSDGDAAYRLLGSLTAASQLTSVMLAETRRTSKRLRRTRRRGSAIGRVSWRLGQHRPLVVPLRRQHRAASSNRQDAEERAIAREPAEGPVRADANPVRHRGSCTRGNVERTPTPRSVV